MLCKFAHFMSINSCWSWSVPLNHFHFSGVPAHIQGTGESPTTAVLQERHKWVWSVHRALLPRCSTSELWPCNSLISYLETITPHQRVYLWFHDQHSFVRALSITVSWQQDAVLQKHSLQGSSMLRSSMEALACKTFGIWLHVLGNI